MNICAEIKWFIWKPLCLSLGSKQGHKAGSGTDHVLRHQERKKPARMVVVYGEVNHCRMKPHPLFKTTFWKGTKCWFGGEIYTTSLQKKKSAEQQDQSQLPRPPALWSTHSAALSPFPHAMFF